MNRRDLLRGAALLTIASAAPAQFTQSTPDTSSLRINPDRLRKRLEDLSAFGRPAGGAFADGVSRLGYSDADLAARRWAMDQMRAAGLDVRLDPAANIFGRRSGSVATNVMRFLPEQKPAIHLDTLKPILFGSHIDSVPSGGNFDGDVGSMSAIEVAHTLREHNITTRHPIQVCIWTNEDGGGGGGLDGSRAVAGQLRANESSETRNGVPWADALRKIGGDPDHIAQAQMQPGSIAAYLELHIEQGGTLDRAKTPIGVVEGIVAIDAYDVVIHGVANHAGTTPMPERKNALLAAAQLINAVQDTVMTEPGRQVGTVGKIAVQPGAQNIIPGVATLTIELRDLSQEKIGRLGDEIKRRAKEIARDTGTTIDFTPVEHLAPALATPAIQDKIEAAATALGLKTSRLPSGAGHDAQMLARVGPMGMIFVPSVGGLSHTPKEFSRWDEIANGANVLLQTILSSDKE